MNPVDRMRVQRHAEGGDASAKRLLDLVDALQAAITLTDGVSQARGIAGEHDDVYGETIDEMMGVLVPSLMIALDCQTAAEFSDCIVGYIPDSYDPSEENEQ